MLVEKICEYTGHTGSIYALALTETETTAFSSGDDGIVAAWDLGQHGGDARALLRVDKAVYALAAMGELNSLAVGMSDGNLHWLSLADKQAPRSLRKIAEPVYGLFFEPGRNYLWVLYGKGFLWILHMPDGKEVGFVRLSEDHLRGFLPWYEQNKLFIAASDRHILALTLDTGETEARWLAHDNSVFALARHPLGRYLLSGGRDAHLNVWDARPPYSRLESIPAHNFTVNDIAFSPDGALFATASRDKTIKIWDAERVQLLKVIDMFRHQGHRHSVNRLHWLGDGSLLSASDDRRLIRWKLTAGEEK